MVALGLTESLADGHDDGALVEAMLGDDEANKGSRLGQED